MARFTVHCTCNRVSCTPRNRCASCQRIEIGIAPLIHAWLDGHTMALEVTGQEQPRDRTLVIESTD